MRILSFGSLNYDYVYGVEHFHVPKETLAAQSFYRNFGGKGLNQSVAMAKAGLEVWHAGRVGADGQPFIDFLAGNHVHTDYILKDDTITTGHAIIEVCQAQNRILLYGGANKAVDEKQADAVLEHFGEGDILVLQNEISCIPYIMKAAKAKGLRIMFNAAPMEPEVFRYPLELADFLCVNEIEGAGLLSEEQELMIEHSPARIAEMLHEKYPDTCILLTAGEDGSYYYGDRESFHVPAQQVQAVDTTAAGDTYSGYFLARLGLYNDVKKAMELATCASAMTVQKAGAAGSVPTLCEVLEQFPAFEGKK